jgi:hypothetical protein
LESGADCPCQQPFLHLAGQLSQRHAHRLGHGGLIRDDFFVLVGLPTAIPFLAVFLAVHPSTYRTAGLRRGTAA